MLNEKGVSRVEAFFTIAVSSFGDITPESAQLTRVLCLLSEAVYTHWLQIICPTTIKKYKRYIQLCPWPIERIKYLGACWDSPLRQGFHSTLFRNTQTREEMRLAKNEYQKIRNQTATAQQKKASFEKKKKRYQLSGNERRKQLRESESAKDKEKRLQRRYQEPKYKGTIFMKRALARCYHCGEKAHNIRKCPQMPKDRWNKSRCSQCRQPNHNVLSCKATKQPLDTVPALWIELTVSADVVVDRGGGSSRMGEGWEVLRKVDQVRR